MTEFWNLDTGRFWGHKSIKPDACVSHIMASDVENDKITEADKAILEYLNLIFPSAEPPPVIFYNIGERSDELRYYEGINGLLTIDSLRSRISVLKTAGFIELARENRDYLVLTEKGRRFLREDDDDVGGDDC